MTPSLSIAITGATGFLGPYVIEQARLRGHKLRVLARSPSKLGPDLDPSIRVIKGSLSDIPPEFTHGADVVLHMAGLIKARSTADFFEVNADGTGNLAAQAAHNKVSRFVYLSSQAASQPQLSDYAASKQAGESALMENYKGERIIIRSPAVFGPGDEATAPFFAFMKRGILPVPGGKGWRTRKLSLIYAPDLARFIIGQIEHGAGNGPPPMPASTPSLTWPQFAEAASEVMGRPVKARALPLTLLRCIAGMNSVFFRRLFNPHLTLGKLSEFLYEDWSVAAAIDDPTPLNTALLETFKAQTQTAPS